MMSERIFKRIRIRIETPIASPCNGPTKKGKTNTLLNLNDGKFLVKGFRGLINHSMMAIAQQQGIEVCHSSQKTETKEGETFLPEGFHPNGACYPNNECIKHRLMGSIKKPSILKFEPVIVKYGKNGKKGSTPVGVSALQISTNKHNTLVYGTKRSIQDYHERFISGEFELFIELLEELTTEELRFLIEAILYCPELGLGGKINNGSGRLNLLELNYQKVIRTRTIGKKGQILEEETVRNQWKELEEALEA
jgi:hypothetical protein